MVEKGKSLTLGIEFEKQDLSNDKILGLSVGNVIKDKKIGSFTLRHQVLTDFPPKELRSVVDQSKKDIKEGIAVSYTHLTLPTILLV